jgi:hypothetical protein
MVNQRDHFRFPVRRRGLVTHDKKTMLCEVLDLTERGLRLTADVPLAMGDRVKIEVQLDGNCIIHCELLVTHTDRPVFGGRITQILPEDEQKLTLYIERLVRSSIAEPPPTP